MNKTPLNINTNANEFHTLPGELGISEIVTSYLDGEATVDEVEIAKKIIQSSPEILIEAQDIQRAWDLLDFLPVMVSTEAKTIETMAVVLRESGSGPMALEESALHGANSVFASNSGVSNAVFQENIHLKFYKKISFLRIILMAAVIGGCLGFFSLILCRVFDPRQTAQKSIAIGLVDNIEILRDAKNLDFLRAIAVPELFGQPDSLENP